MKMYILSLALVVAAVSGSAQLAAATSIDTTSSNGGGLQFFGSGPLLWTIGQIFTVSGSDTQLDSFSLFLTDTGSSSGILDLRGYIASWDSVNFHASSILFESATQTMTAANTGTVQEFAFSPGLGVTAGQQYVAFLSVSNLPLQPAVELVVPLAGPVLSGGEFVGLDSGTTPSLLISSPWLDAGGNLNVDDLWFKASRSAPSAVPEPSSLPLLDSGLVALAVWRRKHAA
jgi:hypothetical protein